jgi:predicted DNA binding protein
MKSKQELIDYIARQTNITLKNNPDSVLNSKRKILYTTINRTNRNTVLSLLNRNGIRYESHIHDNYFIYI